jgi:hypothetical protein
MNKWHLRFLRLAYFGLAAILPIYALADYNGTQGSGIIFRAFDSTHGGTSLCAAATTQCAAIGLINSAGAEIATAGAPLRVDPTGTTTQPVSQPTAANLNATVVQATAANLNATVTGTITANAGTNLNTSALGTSANQTSQITQETATAAALGTTADAACSTDNGTCTLIALTKRTNQNLTGTDPCTSAAAKVNFAIATASGTLQLVAPSSSTQVYVCSFSVIAAATAVVNLVGGTGATCTTGTPVAALGSITAANGMSLAANGGLTYGSGVGTVVRTTTAGHGLCLIQSGTTALAGNLTYVQQ